MNEQIKKERFIEGISYRDSAYLALYSLAIGILSGFGVLFILTALGRTGLEAMFWSYAIGTGLSMVYSITEYERLDHVYQNKERDE